MSPRQRKCSSASRNCQPDANQLLTLSTCNPSFRCGQVLSGGSEALANSEHWRYRCCRMSRSTNYMELEAQLWSGTGGVLGGMAVSTPGRSQLSQQCF